MLVMSHQRLTLANDNNNNNNSNNDIEICKVRKVSELNLRRRQLPDG